MLLSQALSELTGMSIYMKNDYKQVTGSFKERGACNTLLLLTKQQQQAGVIAASGKLHWVTTSNLSQLPLLLRSSRLFSYIFLIYKKICTYMVAGNHALALAYHGKRLGISVTVVMPEISPITKVNNCRKHGANVIIQGII